MTKGRTAAVAAFALYTLLALVYLRPVWQVWQDRIAPDTGDPLFNLWVLEWGAHQIRQGLPDVWNANIFHPTTGTLAFSDHLLGPAVFLALFETAVPNPIAGYNLLFFLAFPLTGLAVAWVVRRSGASWTAAGLAGAMYAFSPFRLSQLNHLQILMAMWVPLTLWFWDRLLAERTGRNAALFLLFYLLNVTGGCYLAYMTHVPMLVMLLNRLAVHGRDLVSRRSLRVLVPAGLATGLALAAIFLPYVRTGKALGLARDSYEAAHYGATTLSWLSPARNSLWFGPATKRFVRRQLGGAAEPFFRTENALFCGWLATILGLAGLWLLARRSGTPPPNGWRRAVLLALLAAAAAAWAAADALTLSWSGQARLPHIAKIAVPAWHGLLAALLLSLAAWAWLRRRWTGGPWRRWQEMPVWDRGLAFSGLACFALAHPLFYVPLMRVVPGLDGMRVPARFAAFVSLAAVFFAARALDAGLARWRGHGGGRGARLAVLGALALVLVAELAPRPIRWARLQRQEDLPPVYTWIAQQDDVKAILELPIRPNVSEVSYMYASTVHWKPLANGYSGYLPPSHRRLTSQMRHLPDGAGLDLVAELGITHLVVHTEPLRAKKRLGLLRRWEREFLGKRVERVHESGPDRVYRVLR